MADTGIRGHRSGHADALPPVRGLPARDTGRTQNFIISYPFASTEEEIHFFKELKPLLASKIIYYNTVYKIEVRFPSGSEEVQRDYLLSETDRISKSFQRNLAFYQYHRTKATYLDRQYFMRGKPDIQIIVDSFYYETDPQFSTSHDFKVAKILANELLEIYLTNRLHELERREQRKRVKNGFTGKVLRWTGTKRALVELVYALHACGCLNKGTVDIKEIVAYLNMFSTSTSATSTIPTWNSKPRPKTARASSPP